MAKKRPELGRLRVGEYLDHYGIGFDAKKLWPKHLAGRTLYLLHRCLFDSSHKKPAAAIIQDAKGHLTYNCFHNSCSGKKWADVRAEISGNDPISQFCEK